MAINVLSVNTSFTGVNPTTFNSDLYVTRTTTIVAQTDTAVLVAGSNRWIGIDGTLIGDQYGMRVGNTAATDSFNTVTVGSSGVLRGAVGGLGLFGTDIFLTNHGEISGRDYGVVLQLAGSISSDGTRIINSGTIDGDFYGLLCSNVASPSIVTVINTGVISSQAGFSFASTSSGTDWIKNRGQMIGTIDLSGGNDIYDGRGGTVEGVVLGGSGDDKFIAGLSAEDFFGDAGIDTLDFLRSNGVVVSLANDRVNTREAAGDFYIGIENVIGSNVGADRIYGDINANTLEGRGGADGLYGGDGNDSLAGGAGIDTLTGGFGGDSFVFDQLSDCGDKITDFNNVTGDNDVIRINASRFGGGLTAGLLKIGELVQRGDHVANLATDRFIFDTTDKSLWFDVDGTGSKAAILVADLQFSATFSDFDIFFV